MAAQAFALLLLALVADSQAATCGQPRNVTLRVPMVSYLVNRIQTRMFQVTTNDTEGQRYYPLVPGCIRLAFHACAASRCSSYINLSDPNNNGLQPVVAIIDALWSSIQTNQTWSGFSKADMYALCGIAALEIATNYTKSIVYRYGRTDFCPGDNVRDLRAELPPRSFGTTDTFNYFKRVFNFTANETVAIMGAHSLGLLHEFGTLRPLNRWTNNRPHFYSNEYYSRLLQTSWNQVSQQYNRVPYRLFEWRQPSTKNRFMLNCDMGVVKQVDIRNSTTGASMCTAYTNCSTLSTASVIRTFANDADRALTAFVAAYSKMIENGQSASLRSVLK